MTTRGLLRNYCEPVRAQGEDGLIKPCTVGPGRSCGEGRALRQVPEKIHHMSSALFFIEKSIYK